ncbi:MAG TPA: DUF6750 family protein [Gammaproteobacteria bacterium]|nr:DUF6750 family protein [Gammaproteobacteria bacterium]
MLGKKLSHVLKANGGLGLLYGILFALWVGDVAADGQSLSDIVGTVKTNVLSLGSLLTIISYIAGVGFAIAGIVKFKAHKDNPTQIALSVPIVYLVVGAGLLFLPSIMQSAGTTVFGSGAATSAGKGATTLEN